jgi:type I restriction enzyme, R subunit
VGALPRTVLNKLHLVRKQGNKAAHGQPATSQIAIELLRECFDLGRWFHSVIGDGRPSDWIPFRERQSEGEAASVLQKERRAALERLALQEAQMQQMLTALDEQRQKSLRTQQNTEALQHAIDTIQATGQSAADQLRFDEATARKRLIDIGLHDANWNIAADGSDTEDVGQEYEVDRQPTESGKGRIDYASDKP